MHGPRRCQKGRGPAAETTEETAFLLRGGILLFGMVLVAPLIRRHLFPHRVNVLAAALPRGLSAYVAGGGSTHDVLLWKVRLGSVGDSLRIDECCIRMSCVVSALGQAEEDGLGFVGSYSRL